MIQSGIVQFALKRSEEKVMAAIVTLFIPRICAHCSNVIRPGRNVAIREDRVGKGKIGEGLLGQARDVERLYYHNRATYHRAGGAGGGRTR